MSYRRMSHALTSMHKILLNKAPVYLTSRINYRRDIHGYETRNNNLINTKKLKKAIKSEAFFQKTAKDYSELLANNIINTDMSVNMFKRRCKKYLLGKQHRE